MRPWFARVLGGALFAAGVGCLYGGWRHFVLASQGDLYADFHRAAAVLLIAAGLLIVLSGLRLGLCPSLCQPYPFLTLGRFWRWLLVGLLGIFCVLGLWMPGQDLARYPCRGACAFWFALLLLPFLIPDALVQRLVAWSQTRWFKLLDLAVGNLVLLAILLELGLRGLALWTGQDALLFNRTTGYRLKPGVYENGLRANSLGFADEEWTKQKRSGVVRIAALGDSFSAGTAVAYKENYLTRLETELGNVDVCNFGVCGTGPREYEQLLKTLVWDYQPDLVLVPIFIGNDITEWIATPELLKFHPDALCIEVLARRTYRLLREQWRQSAEGQSTDYRMGRGPQFSERTYLELTAGRLVVCRKQGTRTDEERWDKVRHHLERLIADCRGHHVPVVVVLIPDEFQVNDDLRQKALSVRGWSASDLDLLLAQRRLAEFCRQHAVPCLDLHPRMAEQGATAHLRNDGHWNVHGHHVAANTIAGWLQAEFPERFQSQASARVPSLEALSQPP